MPDSFSGEPMLDMYIFETTQLIEQLEQIIIDSEKCDFFTEDVINEIFRIMHTIKGSSAMMMFNNVTTLAHSTEDLFYFLREEKPENIECTKLSDIVLKSIDFIKTEVEKISIGKASDGDASSLVADIKDLLSTLKQNNPLTVDSIKDNKISNKQTVIEQKNDESLPANDILCQNAFEAVIFFEDGCEMENIRAFGVVNSIEAYANEIKHIPKDFFEDDSSIETIRKEGFKLFFKTDKSYDEVHKILMETALLRELKLTKQEFHKDKKEAAVKPPDGSEVRSDSKNEKSSHQTHQTIISVNVAKLDKLMDLMGEMVIAETMVTQNPDIRGLELDNFQKASRQLHKITSELRDIVMSIRMVPLSTTFYKMYRIVRDMSKKLNKEVELKLIGEETEVDKNIIEHISDPLMHLVRNSIDHGIGSADDRKKLNKPRVGTITLEAKNSGSDVLIIVKDDGRGMNKEKILQRARENNILKKPEEEMTDKEIYNLIFLPGFSTKDEVSEFSGRGVGMDVVVKNIEAVGGSVAVDSEEGVGSTIIIKIPLTLAIVDGMNISVGNSRYTIPTTAIKESFRPKEADIIRDPDGNEMIMVRGQCYPILRLHEFYKVKTNIMNFSEGILIMTEQNGRTICIFADELLGQQQVVIKALPNYIKNMRKIKGITGCTLLGDGSISLILDVGGLI